LRYRASVVPPKTESEFIAGMSPSLPARFARLWKRFIGANPQFFAVDTPLHRSTSLRRASENTFLAPSRCSGTEPLADEAGRCHTGPGNPIACSITSRMTGPSGGGREGGRRWRVTAAMPGGLGSNGA